MKPIKEWDTARKGYRFSQQTFYGSKHLGVDHIVPSGTPLYAPFNGTIVWEGYGSQGGNTLHFRPDDQNIVIRFMHLSEFKKGQVRASEGELIALTGNTGSATTGAHLHTDISKGSVNYNDFNNFINPETFNWGGVSMNGLKLWDNNGQVWAEFDNKQFYVENPKSIEGLSIVKGQPSGEILIKQKDQDARLAQLRTEMQGQIDARDVQIKGLNAKIEQLKDEKVTLKAQVDECKKEIELLKDLLQDESEASTSCEADRDKLQKQIDEHKCEVKEMTAWEHFKMFISKLIERK